jgi:Tol biopolymer transport system component
LWTPDGERIVFYSGRDGGGLFSSSADGTGTPERWTTSKAVQIPYSWADSGRLLIFQQGLDYTRRRTVDPRSSVYTLNRETKATTLLLDNAFQPALSPDGRWMAYTSLESRDAPAGETLRMQEVIYVRPFPNVQQSRSQISTTNGGTSPLWSPDGKELFFVSRDGEAMTTSISTDPSFRPATPRVLFALPAVYTGGIGRSTRQWDITADGERFIVINPGTGSADEGAGQVVLVLNWLEELKRLVPVN